MDPARLQAVEAIFHAALDVEPSRLEQFLDERCAGDASLRRDVESLLAAHRRAGGFIDTPIATLDSRLFEDEEPDRLVGQTIGHWEILRQIGSGGMGCGLSRPARRPPVRAAGRAQAHQARHGYGRGAAPLPERAADPRRLRSPEHRAAARRRYDRRRPSVLRHGVRRGPADRRVLRPECPRRHRTTPAFSPGVRRGLLRAPPRRHSSRPEAARTSWWAATACRSCSTSGSPGCSRPATRAESPATLLEQRVHDAGVREPGAAARRARHDGERRLFARRRAVPPADRPAAVPAEGAVGGRHGARGPADGAAEAERRGRGRRRAAAARRPRQHRADGAAQGAGAALPVGRAVLRGHPPSPREPAGAGARATRSPIARASSSGAIRRCRSPRRSSS